MAQIWQAESAFRNANNTADSQQKTVQKPYFGMPFKGIDIYKKFTMKFIICCAVIVVFVLNYFAANAQSSLEIHVNNIKSKKGSIQFGLFTTEADYLKNPVEKKVVKSTGKDVTVVFENLQPGDYALSVIHDENENGALDSNALGIPKEGFAFGNNALGSFGPPPFEKAKITITDVDVKQDIKLKYF